MRSIVLAVVLTALGTVSLSTASAATPYLVKDINQQLAPVGSYPERYLSLGSAAVFTTTDGKGHALELWRTDRTAAGTCKLSGAPDEMVVWNARVWFTLGGALWSTDGTVAGTQKLTLPVTSPALAPSYLMAGPAYLYFFDNGMLWRTNGTTAGTARVSALVMTPGRSALEPDRPWSAVSGTSLLFLAHTDSLGLELWKVTDAGTLTELLDLTTTEATYLQAVGSLVYLQVKHDNVVQLFRSDGTTAGTVPLLMSPLLPTGDPIRLSGFAKIVTAGSLVYFAGSDMSGRRLWRSDGTNVGTVGLANSLPGAASAFDATPVVRLPNGTVLSYGTSLPAGTGVGLWAFSGTTTTFLANLPLTSKPVEVNLAGNVAIIGCGNRVWRSDGTIGGTYDLGLTDGSYGQRAWPGVALGSSVIFSAYGDGHGVEPWKTDGSIANTVYIKDIAEGTAGAEVRHLVAFRGGLLFEASSVVTNNTRYPELWFTNGTDAGTRKLLDGQTGDDVTACGGRAYFSRYTAGTGLEPWTTDGTVAGTVLLKDLLPGQLAASDPDAPGPNSSRPRYFTCVDGTIFFQADGGSGITDLWRSDGTSAGTTKLHSFGTTLGDRSVPSGPPVAANHRLIVPVVGSNYFTGVALWSSDGTEAGTSAFTVLRYGFYSAEVFAADGFAYIVTAYSDTQKHLWRTDGTEAGTVLVLDGRPIGFLTDFHGRLAFTTYYGTSSARICMTGGTSPDACITPAARSGELTYGMLPLNGRLYYNTPVLRSTNGLDEQPGTLLRATQLLATAGGRMFVNGAIDPSLAAVRLLRTDGTLAGTEALMESQATEVKASGGRAYIAGDELYALDLEVTPTGFSPTTVATPGGQTITISGRGFTGPVTVRVGGIDATIGTVTGTSIAFTAPAHDFGTYPIELTLGDGRRMTLDEPLAYTCVATAVITPLSAPVCPLTPVKLHGSGGVRCSWLPVAGLDDPASCSPTATVSVTTTYRLQVFSANGCPSANYPGVTIDVYTPPAVPVITVANAPDDVVQGKTTYTASVPDAGAGASYAWFIPGATIMAGQGTRTVSFRPSCGFYLYPEVTVTSATGCVTTGHKDLTIAQAAMQSISPRVVNPGTLMTVSGSSLQCLTNIYMRSRHDSGAFIDAQITWVVIDSNTIQFRFPANTSRLSYLREGTGTYPVHPVSDLSLTRAVPRDFANDRKTDVFWRNTATGATSIWNISGATFTGLVSTSAPAPWEPAVFGDFNGDTRSDVFWHNPVTGETSIWLMAGITPSTTVRSTRVPVGWKPAGAGDFNGDGKTDIFWTNPSTGETSIWFMDGIVVASAVRSITVPTDWRPAGFGDFNVDAKCDIVWLRASTGETSIWLMNGTGTPGTAVRSETLAGFNIAGCADFNGDRRDDIFWHNPTTGATLAWDMSGAAIVNKQAGIMAPAGFVPATLGTFDDNSWADVFWYNPSTGETSVWLRSATSSIGPSPLLRIENLDWKPVIVP